MKAKNKPLSFEQIQARKQKAKWARILRVYGLTQEQYNELNRGHCPVCVREWSATVVPCIDHDHKTGAVRGLLCRYCNRYGVGRFRDPDIVKRIYEYLRDARTEWIVPKKVRPKRKKKNA